MIDIEIKLLINLQVHVRTSKGIEFITDRKLQKLNMATSKYKQRSLLTYHLNNYAFLT